MTPASRGVPVFPGSLCRVGVLAHRFGDNGAVLVVKPQQMGLDTLDGKLSSENESTKAGTFDGDKTKHVLDIAVWQAERDARIEDPPPMSGKE
jgi:hypothetical protein